MKKLVLVSLIIFLFSGCGLFEATVNQQMNKSADELAAEGAAALQKKDYKAALKAYYDIKDWYPYSQYAILAEISIANSHFFLKEYDEALAAYEEFERQHPRNKAIPYVIYQRGLCWFKRVRSIDRDHTPALNSISQFKRLIDQYPDSEYTPKAKEHIEKSMGIIIAHELYVADFYMKTKKYKAALSRYKDIVKKYPGTPEAKIAAEKIQGIKTIVSTSF
jgi:outer membrane protein assembly factor BamD